MGNLATKAKKIMVDTVDEIANKDSITLPAKKIQVDAVDEIANNDSITLSVVKMGRDIGKGIISDSKKDVVDMGRDMGMGIISDSKKDLIEIGKGAIDDSFKMQVIAISIGVIGLCFVHTVWYQTQMLKAKKKPKKKKKEEESAAKDYI